MREKRERERERKRERDKRNTKALSFRIAFVTPRG